MNDKTRITRRDILISRRFWETIFAQMAFGVIIFAWLFMAFWG